MSATGSLRCLCEGVCMCMCAFVQVPEIKWVQIIANGGYYSKVAENCKQQFGRLFAHCSTI